MKPGATAIHASSLSITYRPIRGPVDAPALRAVHEGRREVDGVDPLSSAEVYPTAGALAKLLAAAMEKRHADRWRVSEVEGVVAGYGRVIDWQEADGMRVYLALGWVLPEWRGRGIGTALLRWGENTARELAAREHPGEPFEFAGNASSTERDATTLLLNEGYRPGYTVLKMGLDPLIPLPDVAAPPGFDVRPVGPKHLVPISECIADAYGHEYAGRRYQEVFDPLDYAVELGGQQHDPALWQVAWVGDEVAGQALIEIEDGRAEVFEVSVRPQWRRQGLARYLLVEALRGLRERGIEVIRLGTVAEFPTRAVDLYREVGFRVLKEYPRYRKSPV
jgi:mycothiol synthase